MPAAGPPALGSASTMVVRTPPHDLRKAPTAARAPHARGQRVGWWLFVAHLATVAGLAVSNIFHGLALLWTIASGARRRFTRWRWSRLRPLLAPLGWYYLFLAVSVAMSYDPRRSLGALGEVITLSTLPLAALWVRGPRATRRVFDVLIAVSGLLAAYGIGQFFFSDYGSIQKRIPGPFSHYQTFAGVLLIGDLLLIARLAAPGGRRRGWEWVTLVAVNWTLVLTMTRGSWVALVSAFAVLVVVLGRWRMLFFGLPTLLLVVALAPASWQARARAIWDLRDPSSYDRLCMAEASLHMVRDRPLFGLGPRQVKERYPIYRHPTAVRYQVTHLHNSFLQQAAERGLLALGAYVWLMLRCAQLAHRGYRRSLARGGGRASLHLGVLLVLVGFNVAGLFEANWRDTEVQRLVLFVLAVPLCLWPARTPVPDPSRATRRATSAAVPARAR